MEIPRARHPTPRPRPRAYSNANPNRNDTGDSKIRNANSTNDKRPQSRIAFGWSVS